jgi:hypothetical protein
MRSQVGQPQAEVTWKHRNGNALRLRHLNLSQQSDGIFVEIYMAVCVDHVIENSD